MRLGRLVFAAGWMLGIVLGLACSDDDGAVPAPAGGGKGDHGSVGGGVGPRRDAGHDEDDEDSGAPGADSGTGSDGVPRAECYDVEPAAYLADTTLGDFNNAIGKPTDFVVTRVLATWDPDVGCESPTILIALSDGRCPKGGGHELSFYIDAQAIVDGVVGPGVNLITPEPDQLGMRVRYIRPESLKPSGNWGSCAGAKGMLSIRGELDANDLRDVQGQFELELTACDGSGAALQSVIGTFNAKMRRSLDDVCPKK